MNEVGVFILGQLLGAVIRHYLDPLIDTHIPHFNHPKPMPEIFLQTDEHWKNLPLGDSPYFVGTPGVGYGCAVCTLANLFAQAGYTTDPGIFTSWLNHNGGFTTRNYEPSLPDGGSGLLYWRVPQQLFPGYHYGTHGEGRLNAEIWRADAGKGSHFQLRIGDRVLDSIGGSSSWSVAKNWRKYADVSCEYATPTPHEEVNPPAPDAYTSFVPMSGSILVNTPLKPSGSHYGLNVRTEADPTSPIVTTVSYLNSKGTRTGLFITGAIRGTDQSVWYKSQNGHWFCSDYTSQPLK